LAFAFSHDVPPSLSSAGRRRAVGGDVALHDVDAVDGDVEPVAVLILEVEVVALGVGDLHVRRPR
jgi:hypothetical protein